MALISKKVGVNHALANRLGTIIAIVAVFVTLGTQGLLAQSGRANIGGTVTDSQGAVVSGATVTATNVATGVATPATSNGAGAYSILQLIPGTYNIKVEKEGFGAQQKENVTLTAEQNLGADFALQPGKVTEKVTVEAGSELVHTESAELSQTINEKSILELPLNGRNPASLVLLTPGTTDLMARVPGQGTQSFTTFPTETAASTNGQRQGGTLYLLDGAYNEDSYQLAAAPFPNPDATQEFTVIGNNFDPRYGFAPGGVVSIVTKSGTNNWHGDAFEFYRNGGFNAKDFFTGLTNEVHRNQFGGSLGGPVIKDKLFVFGNYQGTRQSIFNAGSNGFMWTPAMINNGDFSAYCTGGFDSSGLCLDRHTGPDPNNPSQTITFVDHQIMTANATGYPQSGVPLSVLQGHPANSSGVGGLYYPGNMIDPASFSAPAVALAKAIAGNLTPLNSFGSILGAGYPTLNNFNEETVRGDYDLNDRNRISARMFLNYFTQPAFSGGNAVASNRSWLNNYQNYAGTWTWTINPHMVNNLTGSYLRMYDTSNSGLKIDGKGICYSQFIAVSDSNTTPCSIEELDINGGYQSTGGFPGNYQNFNGVNRWTWGVSDNLSISKGKHLLVAGIDVLRQYWYVGTDWQSLPRLGFDGGPEGQFTGNGFSDFLLGDESFLSQDGGTSQAVNAWMIAPYVADQIKLTPHLTLSAGLRYEPWIAPTTAGRISAFVPGQQSTRYPNAPVGMVFPGDAGVASAGVPSDYWRFFDPRLGIAWQPKALPNTSIRAAFGMYATPIDYSSWNHASELTPFSPAYGFSTGSTVTDPQGNSSVIPIIPFANPWSVYTPLGGVNPYPPFATAGSSPGPSALFFPPINIQTAFAKNYTDGRTYTWNLSLEHQFGANWLVKAAYVASESDHQSLQNDSNAAPVCATCLAAGTNPRPDQNFTQVDVYQSIGTANYQSGQFTLEKRFNHGLQFQANYTYSHSIDIAATGTGINGGILDDPSCLRCNRGNSFIDTPQVFVLNFVYETPSLAGWNRATKLALGGWQLSAIYRAQSGVPMEILCGCTSSWQDAGSDWASYAPNVTSSHTNGIDLSNRDSSGIHGYLNYADFVTTPQGSSGTVGKNPPGMFAPGVNTWDMNMSKNFRITERYRFQFRWEMFNAFNRVTFDGPYYDGTSSVSAGSTNFGLINSTNPAYPARVMQAAGKFTF